MGGIPIYVFRTPDNNYGLYPYPDKAYTLKFDAYAKPTALSATTDVPTIPEQFRQVIVDGATAYGYQYRGEAQQYGINFARFGDENKTHAKPIYQQGLPVTCVQLYSGTHKDTHSVFPIRNVKHG